MKTISIESQRLSEARLVGDQYADDLIQKIMEDNTLEGVNFVFDLLGRNKELPENLPSYLKEYFDTSNNILSGIDQAKVEKGMAFFKAYGPQISMMLLCKSLPSTYACRRGVEVLYRTGRFMKSKEGSLNPFVRRLMETSQFVLDVMSEGGILSNGVGVRTAQKVRLMHAAIRYYLLNNTHVSWDQEDLGIPINQEDMAGTLLSFAVYPIQGLEQIGVEVSEEEKEAYLYVWQHIGRIMGVKEELIPQSFKEGEQLGLEILNDQKEASEAGKELTKACVDFLEHVTPGTLFDFYPQVLINFLIGDELSEMVGISTSHERVGRLMNKVLCFLQDGIDDAIDHSSLVRYLATYFNQHLLQGMINYFNPDAETHFYIPPSLRDNWINTSKQHNWKEVLSTPSMLNWRLSLQHKN
ncbi:oxygenase MpaB family protein [Algivirga pacifica]|uniref:Oxygenase MpaB family protein n=1 Tax=Algivirga pacifica TaxID=1162670 RepID=A0ABP9DB66_9BACT